MSWIAPPAANRVSAALMVSTRSGAASVPHGSSGSSGSIWVSTSTSSPKSSRIARSSSWAMSCAAMQRHVAVDLEVDADDQLAAEVVHGDVVDGEPGIARDHHDAFAHALIVARHRHRGEGEVGVAERLR